MELRVYSSQLGPACRVIIMIDEDQVRMSEHCCFFAVTAWHFICFLNAGVIRLQPLRASLPGRVNPASRTAD